MWTGIRDEELTVSYTRLNIKLAQEMYFAQTLFSSVGQGQVEWKRRNGCGTRGRCWIHCGV